MKIIKYALCAFLFGGLVSACNFLDKEPYKLSPEKYFNNGYFDEIVIKMNYFYWHDDFKKIIEI
jgi:hypothetical protein